jgi:glycosyltransferase involved in cell wall biosynthesis
MTKSTPKLAIIVPCFNSEDTLEETLQSILHQEFNDWEAIIVNDGSTDTTEELALKWFDLDKRFRYFRKENEGLGKARNFGIGKTEAEFILPLDSDNLIKPDFAEAAIAILAEKSNIGVVHGDAEYFDKKDGLWKVPKFDLQKILGGNYIDACAIYRRKLWEEVGGYETNMPYQGNEDWDFWIELGKRKVQFYHLEKVTFLYRVRNSSMINSFNEEMFKANRSYIVKKNSLLYFNSYRDLYQRYYQIHKRNSENNGLKSRVLNILKKIR